MPQSRVNSEHIQALKVWLAANREYFEAQFIDRIDAHYTDNAIEGGLFDQISAYRVSESGKTITQVEGFQPSAELMALLEPLVVGDHFSPPDGGGGAFLLLLSSDTIEHESYEYETVRREFDVEKY